MTKYKIIALVGESGVGKDRILNSLSSLPYKWNKIVSCTTRPKRSYEKEGINYHFVDDDYFANNLFIETANFNGWKYGTSEEHLSSEVVNVGVFNPTGIRSLANDPSIEELVIYRIKTNPEERLLRQLERDADVNIKEVVRRYRTDKEDFQKFDKEFALDIRVLWNEDEFNLAENYVEIGRQIRSMNH